MKSLVLGARCMSAFLVGSTNVGYREAACRPNQLLLQSPQSLPLFGSGLLRLIGVSRGQSAKWPKQPEY
jgi:hypothetical protein